MQAIEHFKDCHAQVEDDKMQLVVTAAQAEILAEFEELALEFEKATAGYYTGEVNEALLVCAKRIRDLIESIETTKEQP